MKGRQIRRQTHLTQTFESQYNDHSSNRFMMDRTLYKGIKQNDVSKIIDLSKESGNIGDQELPSEQQELQNIVKDMRKKYDEIKTQTTLLQTELQKNRKTVQLLRSEQTKLSQNNAQAKNNFEKKKNLHENITSNLEAKVYDLDIYKDMIDKLKKDLLVLKKRNFDKDLTLKKGSVKVRTLRQDDFNKNKLSYKCRDMLQSIERTVTSKQYERNNKINTFYDALNRRHETIIKRQERQKEIQQVMMKAMSQKLQEEKQWINICLVNQFFKRFLKNKMEVIIRQNAQIETAYHKIRSSTDIRDCKDLINRFLNRQKYYGNLLERISNMENQLEDLRLEKNHLEKVQMDLVQQSDQFTESMNRNVSSTDPLEKELQILSQNIFVIQEKKELMRKWAVKLFSAFSGKSKEQSLRNKPFKDVIKSALQELHACADNILGDENCSDKINNAFMSTKPSAKIFEEEMHVRNRRIKTTAATDDSLMEADDKEAFYDGNSEIEFLQYNRRVTKKNDQSRRFRIKTQAR